LHHFQPASGVEGEHADGQAGAGLHRLCDGVWDIVQLEVEKDVETEVRDLTHAVRAAGGEHLETDFDPADCALQLPKGGRDFARRRGIQD
jgi:hypothetical protein